MRIDHAAILAGGYGKRLGNITKKTPKPLLKINNLEFIKYLIFDLVINGFKKIVILTHYKDRLFRKELENFEFLNVKIICLKEKKPLGTGGSIAQLKKFKSDFLILNGDSYTRFNYKKFLSIKKIRLSKILIVKNNNYKSNKKLNNLKIDQNSKISFSNNKIYMNAGVYIFKKELIKKFKIEKCSLENDLLPTLINNNLVEGFISKNDFIDIGLKKNLKKTSNFFKKIFKLKAVFFDRDGTLNKNYGYVFKIEKFKWLNGVIDTLKLLNFFKIKIIVITNQSGIGRGYYSMKSYLNLIKEINEKLKKDKIKIDRFYCAPYFKFAKEEIYRSSVNLRKPNNGMIIKAMRDFKLNKKNCFMIGDKKSDLIAAKKSKIQFYKKNKVSLYDQIIKNLQNFQLISKKNF
jgi:D,D-heptose 1,7-bisphosphate phosphatase